MPWECKAKTGRAVFSATTLQLKRRCDKKQVCCGFIGNRLASAAIFRYNNTVLAGYARRDWREVLFLAKAAVIMGSDSDWQVMQETVKTLKTFGIQVEARVISAHRTPQEAGEFAHGAFENGFGVIVAAAGMAAHLAGAIAGHTVLPVIGVPLTSGSLGGMDALLSTVQMPPGVPVATVAVNGATNAAILAVQILAAGEPALWDKLCKYKHTMSQKTRDKNAKINAQAEAI